MYSIAQPAANLGGARCIVFLCLSAHACIMPRSCFCGVDWKISANSCQSYILGQSD